MYKSDRNTSPYFMVGNYKNLNVFKNLFKDSMLHKYTIISVRVYNGLDSAYEENINITNLYVSDINYKFKSAEDYCLQFVINFSINNKKFSFNFEISEFELENIEDTFIYLTNLPLPRIEDIANLICIDIIKNIYLEILYI